MEDAIYLREGSALVEMKKQPYQYEAVLQEKLAEYPRLLGSEETLGKPRQWALIAREKSVPDKEGGNERWSADHLLVDQDGIPTIVEVKRSENTEIRRKIVGQMLDYVAHASLFWNAESLSNRFAETCEELGVSTEETLARLVDDEDIDGFWEDVESNLRSKKIRLIFVADEIPSELKRIVEFLNEAMSSVEVLALEVVQYAGDDQTVFVPRMYGQTEAAKASSSTSSSRSGNEYVETEEEMYDDLDEKLREGDLSEQEYQTFIGLYEFAKEIGDNVDISGAKNANFKMRVDAHRSNHSGRPSVFTANADRMLKVWPASMPINGDAPETSPIEWDPAAYEEFKTDFQSLEGVPSDEPEVYFRDFCQADNLDQFKAIVREFVAHCRDCATNRP